jgi:hypothetical protein
MNDPPTRDFIRWNGTRFHDRERAPKKQNPGPQTGATLDHKLVPVVDHKLVPPSPQSGPQTGAIRAAGGGPQTGAITSLPLGTAVVEADTAPAAREVGMSRQPSCLARLRSHLLSTTGVRYRGQPSSHRLTSRIASHERLQRISAGCGAPGEPGQNIQHAHNRSVGMKSVTIAGPPPYAPATP